MQSPNHTLDPDRPDPKHPDPDRLVMVGRFLDPSEAQFARGMLESAGVECFLQGANANAIVPLAFRVRLSVRQADQDTALVLLAEAELAD